MSKPLGCLLMLVALAGCGDKSESAPKAGAVSPAQPAPAAVDPSAMPLLQRQPLIDRDAYIPYRYSTEPAKTRADAQRQTDTLRRAYWSAAPRNDALLAYDHIEEYRREPDAFKRKDILASRQADVDALYAEAQSRKHFVLTVPSGMRVHAYDEAKGGFMIYGLTSLGSYLYENKPEGYLGQQATSWSIGILGGRPEHAGSRWTGSGVYIPSVEAEARSLEAVIAQFDTYERGSHEFTAKLYGRMVGATEQRKGTRVQQALFAVDAVDLLHPKTGEVIATLGAQALGPDFEVTDDWLYEPLGLTPPVRRGYVTF